MTFPRFFLMAFIWGGFIYLAGTNFAESNFWFVVLSVFMLSVPIIISGVYSNTIELIIRLAIFKEKGWIFRLFFGRTFRVIFWICWALCSSFFMLVQFHSYNALEWLSFFLVIPIFWCVFNFIRRPIAHELKPYIVTNEALTWARLSSPLIMLTIYFLIIRYLGEDTTFSSIAESINAQKEAITGMNGSALVSEVSQYLAFYDGVKDYALQRINGENKTLAQSLFGLSSLVIFYNACAMLSCFLISGVEYRRMLTPLSDDDVPKKLSPSQISVIVGVFTFVVLFIYTWSFANIEMWALEKRAEWSATRQNLELKVVQIDDKYYPNNIGEKLYAARIESLQKVDVSYLYLESEIDRAFDGLEGNVDDYLDWYYSLVGQYAQIASMMTGQLEKLMLQRLELSLAKRDNFKNIQIALDNILTTHTQAQADYQQKATQILDENRFTPASTSFEIVQRISLKEILKPPVHQGIINLKTKVIIVGGQGAIAGVISALAVKKIMGKVIGKSILKPATVALTKVVIGKTAGSVGGAGAGAATGAAIGSFVPGIGNLVGAAIGGIVGAVVVGVSIDKLLLELEEYYSRDKFKGELIAAIEEARHEFKSQLGVN
jgi:hypothetical protein